MNRLCFRRCKDYGLYHLFGHIPHGNGAHLERDLQFPPVYLRTKRQGKERLFKALYCPAAPAGGTLHLFDYAGDLHPSGVPCDCLNVTTQAGIDPFRPLLLGQNCRERPYDTTARVAETVLSIGGTRGSLQQVYLRNTLKDYIERGEANSGLSGLMAQVQNTPELARAMASTLLRLQDLDNLLPPVSQAFFWPLEYPGITVLRFNTLPNLSAQLW